MAGEDEASGTCTQRRNDGDAGRVELLVATSRVQGVRHDIIAVKGDRPRAQYYLFSLAMAPGRSLGARTAVGRGC